MCRIKFSRVQNHLLNCHRRVNAAFTLTSLFMPWKAGTPVLSADADCTVQLAFLDGFIAQVNCYKLAGWLAESRDKCAMDFYICLLRSAMA